MKNILILIIAILFFSFSSNSEVPARTASFDKADICLVKNTTSIDEYREGFEKIKAGENSKPEQNKLEKTFYSKTAEDTDSAFELVFFLGMLILTAFLIALQYLGNHEKAREFQQFD